MNNIKNEENLQKIYQNINESKKILKCINNHDAYEFSKWTFEKTKLRYNSKMPEFPIYNNFIYWCNLGINIGSEQNKIRPVLILRSSKKSNICTIIPLTSKRINDEYWYHVDLSIIDSTALVEQLRVISKLRIIKPYRKKGEMIVISSEDFDSINQQLENLYRLKPLKQTYIDKTT